MDIVQAVFTASFPRAYFPPLRPLEVSRSYGSVQGNGVWTFVQTLCTAHPRCASLHAQESMQCPECSVLSHKSSYVQQLHTISAAALRLQRLMEAEPGLADRSLGQLLQGIEVQHVKSCDKDVGALRSSCLYMLALTGRPVLKCDCSSAMGLASPMLSGRQGGNFFQDRCPPGLSNKCDGQPGPHHVMVSSSLRLRARSMSAPQMATANSVLEFAVDILLQAVVDGERTACARCCARGPQKSLHCSLPGRVCRNLQTALATPCSAYPRCAAVCSVSQSCPPCCNAWSTSDIDGVGLCADLTLPALPRGSRVMCSAFSQFCWQFTIQLRHCHVQSACGLQELDLKEMYEGVRKRCVFLLQSFVGFYGQHYFAFVRQQDSTWIMFDDAQVRSLLTRAVAGYACVLSMC